MSGNMFWTGHGPEIMEIVRLAKETERRKTLCYCIEVLRMHLADEPEALARVTKALFEYEEEKSAGE